MRDEETRVTTTTEDGAGPGLAAPLAAADKTVGRRRGQPLTITETFDNAAVLAAVFTVSAAAAAVLWLRAARRR
jgi:hypothetical protein